MARLRADDLDRLATLLAELRAVEGLSERSPATFTRGRAPFLHFHSLTEGLVADLKVGNGWRRYATGRATGASSCATPVASCAGTSGGSPAGRPDPARRSADKHRPRLGPPRRRHPRRLVISPGASAGACLVGGRAGPRRYDSLETPIWRRHAMATTDTDLAELRLPHGYLPQFATVEEERRHRQERLAASFRLFGKFGFDEG